MATGLVISKRSKDGKELFSLIEYDSLKDTEETLLVSDNENEIMDHAQQYSEQNEYDAELLFDDTTQGVTTSGQN